MRDNKRLLDMNCTSLLLYDLQEGDIALRVMTVSVSGDEIGGVSCGSVWCATDNTLLLFSLLFLGYSRVRTRS